MPPADACPECGEAMPPRRLLCPCGYQRPGRGKAAMPGLRTVDCAQCADPDALWRFIHWLRLPPEDLREHLETHRPGRSADRTTRIDSVLEACADARRKYSGRVWPDGAPMSVAQAWEQDNPPLGWRDALIARTLPRIPHQQSREQQADYVARLLGSMGASSRRAASTGAGAPPPGRLVQRQRRIESAVESVEENIAKLMADGVDAVTATRQVVARLIERATP